MYFLTFVFVCFVLPALMTKRNIDVSAIEKTNEQKENSQQIQNESVAPSFEYKKYGNIRLLHKKTGNVEEVPIDEYLCNVVSAEMPADYEKEALKAQSIVARTYTIYKINNKKHDNADICDDSTCCQAWISKEDRLERWEESKRIENWEKIEESVRETIGKIVTYNNQPINAFFHANSGGVTEIPVNVWGGTGYPYLQVIETTGEEGYTQYASELEFSNEELVNKLKSKYQDIIIDFNNDEEIKILEHTESGRVKTIRLGNHKLSGVEARTLLGLKSTNFEMIKQKNKIKFLVKGYGHGVGMSQTGANTMAKQGKSCEDIIKHFYVGVEIKDVNNV